MNEQFNLFVNKTIEELNNYDVVFRKYIFCDVLFLLKSTEFVIDEKADTSSIKLLYETYFKFLSKLPENLFKIKKQIKLSETLASSLLNNLEIEKNKHLEKLLETIEPIFKSIKEKSSNKQNLSDGNSENVNRWVTQFLELFDKFYASEYENEMKVINIILKHLEKLLI